MDTVTFYANNLGPAIVRRLSTADGDWDIVAGQTFRLRVRALYDSQILLDKIMVADPVANTVTYTPIFSDTLFTTVGIYRAWVYYVNAQQDTEEFELEILSHAPGEGVQVGAIWRAARALEPVSWDALRSYSDYGDVELQRVIELAKLRVLPTTVSAADEQGLDLRVIDYIAKKVLVDNVLSAAISFWTNQTIQQSARGNSDEVVTYPDRIRAAGEAIARYTGDLARQLYEVETILGGVTDAYDAPALDVPSLAPLLTPGLEEYRSLPVTTQRYWRGTR
jgi:hypothetical protein